MPVDAWFEFELEYVRSSGAGATDGLVRLYIDNVNVLEQTNIETWVTGYDDFVARWGLYGANGIIGSWNVEPNSVWFRRMGIANYKMSDGTIGNGP